MDKNKKKKLVQPKKLKKEEVEEDSDYSESDFSDNDNNDKQSDPQARKFGHVLINISDTQYEVIKFVARKLLKWHTSYNVDDDYDILWTDNGVQTDQLAKMQQYQKINHFPGMYSLARKNYLGWNLMKMRKQFPDDYDFFPLTWILPSENGEFRNQFQKNPNQTFIMKPEASCQGRGIQLARSIDQIPIDQHIVVQKYINSPLLIQDLKFDFRLYVLICGCAPLRIYLYKEGLARFATTPYVKPTKDNLDDVCMHLTNYAINKDSGNFIFNQKGIKEGGTGHKRCITAVMKVIIFPQQKYFIRHQRNKELIVQPILAHNYSSAQPNNYSNNMCFEVLGFDVLLDKKYNPWILEVNHTPSFTTDTQLDHEIKSELIKDSLILMNINQKQRELIKNTLKQQMQKRVLTGKKEKITLEEKEKLKQSAQQERDNWEQANLGNYEKIYPLENDEENKKYELFIEHAFKMWQFIIIIISYQILGKSQQAQVNQNKLLFIFQDIRRNTKKVTESTTQQQEKITNQQFGGKLQQPMWNNSNSNTTSIWKQKSDEIEKIYAQQFKIKARSKNPVRNYNPASNLQKQAFQLSKNEEVIQEDEEEIEFKDKDNYSKNSELNSTQRSKCEDSQYDQKYFHFKKFAHYLDNNNFPGIKQNQIEEALRVNQLNRETLANKIVFKNQNEEHSQNKFAHYGRQITNQLDYTSKYDSLNIVKEIKRQRQMVNQQNQSPNKQKLFQIKTGNFVQPKLMDFGDNGILQPEQKLQVITEKLNQFPSTNKQFASKQPGYSFK